MAILMGLDQHRAQITTDWVDTSTGEVSKARVAPADRAGVRRFLARFRGEALEVALEATTGWRFVVEELHRIGAIVHLAEPADTAALRGNKKRAKNDRADARHLRELLMAGRVPESWIAPAHILDLRARVRLRHTLSEQRGEWQQRIQSVLYHHGCPNVLPLSLSTQSVSTKRGAVQTRPVAMRRLCTSQAADMRALRPRPETDGPLARGPGLQHLLSPRPVGQALMSGVRADAAAASLSGIRRARLPSLCGR
jgi:hypothetical protein